MADVNKTYVDYAGLQKYDELIKGKILSDAANAAQEAVEALDTASDVVIASENSGVVTLKAGIAEVDGVITQGSGNDITLAKVATTGAAEDVSYDNTSSGLSADDVQEAIDALANASAGGVASKTVYLQDESAGQADYAKVYKLYQGANSPSAQTDPAALIGTINIPKDLVVQSGHIVTVEDGVDSDGDSTTVADGTYIKLMIQNQTAPLYINVADLIDDYTGGTTSEATVAVSATNEITVTINKIAATKIVYQAADVQKGTPEVNVKQKIDAIEQEISDLTTDVAQDIADAIAALDTASDVALATNNASTGAVTFAGSIAETDGVINAGSADNVVFTPVSQAQIEALFAVTP